MQFSNTSRQRLWGTLAGIGFTTFVLAAIIFALRKETGMFMYPVDDAFIHMEVAKNLAASGTWGINPGEFGSASSSILYTLVLASFFKIFSASFLIPLVVNILAGIGVCFALSSWLSRQQFSFRMHLLILGLVLVLTPLPITVLSGMEHTLQCLFAFLFLFKSAAWITRPREEQTSLPWSIPLLAALTVAIRYEGIFLVAMVGLAMLLHRRWLPAILTGAAALLPVVIFGLWSVSKGSYFLPNSVLIKGNEVPLFGGGLGHLLETVLVEKLTLMKPGITALATQRLLLLLPLTWLLFYRQWKAFPAYSLILLLLTGTTILHLALASTGKFYRYEAYLVLCSSTIVALVFFKFGRELFSRKPGLSWLVGAALLFFTLLPLLLRSSAAFTKAKRSCINIFEQQHQMGRFLKEYYPETTFGANDIGAVSFYTSGKVVDLWGLGSIDIARSRRNSTWQPEWLNAYSRQQGTRLALIYDSWFRNGLEPYWTKVATWRIYNNVVCGDDVVSFYVLDPLDAEPLKRNLQAFSASMPTTVTIEYF